MLNIKILVLGLIIDILAKAYIKFILYIKKED
jgi:hypothetical protein